MKWSDAEPPAPPRLLLGAALLFWGAMVGSPLTGLVCAFLVEGRSWLRLRWNFTNEAFVRAWWISLGLLTLALAWEWVGGNSYLSLFAILGWLPVLFLPLIFVQQYALQRLFPLNTFSMVARRKMIQDRKEGREVDPVMIHFGYVYFSLTLIAASFGEARHGGSFLIGLVLFGAAALFFTLKNQKKRPLAWAVVVILAATIGYGGSVGLQRFYRYIESGDFLNRGLDRRFADTSVTQIGEVGGIKLSHDVRWRMRVESGVTPGLMREAVFNNYSGGVWGYTPPMGQSKREDEEDMSQRGVESYRYVFDRRDYDVDRESGVGKITVTGAVSSRGYQTALPLPAGARLLDDIRVEGATYTSLGTVMAENPEVSVLRFDAYHLDETRNEGDPYERHDLIVAETDREAVRRVVDKLALREVPPQVALARVRQFFAEEFQYTLDQQWPASVPRYQRRSITYFLETGKKGHCEYFATAAALILREAGIPARYATGFAAKEQADSGEWLLRGQHGHAWCRVYLGGEEAMDVVEDGENRGEYLLWTGGRWVDFDPTPSNWLAIEGSKVSWDQRIKDWWQKVREEVLLWRTQEGIQAKVSWSMGVAGAIVLAFVIFRLWRGLVVDKSGGGKAALIPQIDRASPLAKLRRPVEKLVGPRRAGEPVGEWLGRVGECRPAVADSLRQVSDLYRRSRFDPVALTPEDSRRFEDLCRSVRRKL